jgi:hypothetical protein
MYVGRQPKFRRETPPPLGRTWGMVPRATLIAVLVGVEMALVFAMVVAMGGGPKASYGGWPGAPAGAPALNPLTPGQTFPAGDHPALVIDVGMADVTIETHPDARIDVAVTDGFHHVGSQAPILSRADGNTVRISADESDFWAWLGDSRVVHITAPPETRVVIANGGNIRLTGLRADATVTSGAHFHAGDGISIRDFRGSLTATSPDGRIDVTDADCPQLHLTSSNGRVTLTRVRAQQIFATSSNGRVEGTGLQLRDGSVASSNGRVSLGFASGADTTVTAGADNGRVRLSGFAATAATNVHRSDDEDDDDSSAAQTVRVGAGSGRLDVRASNGSIDLSQEG